MKKLLTLVSITALLLPSLAFAAYNDVSLTTGVTLSVNSITLNVSGSTATIESIEVGSTTFTVTLQANSAFEVTAPDFNVLTTNQPLGVSTDVCTGTLSKIGYTASSTEIVATVTPSATLCTSPSANTSGGTGSSSSGGGGTTVVTPVTPVTPVVTAATKAEMIATIKAQIVTLLQKLIAQLIAELQAKIQAGGN